MNILSTGQVRMLWAVIFFAVTHASVKQLSHIPFFELVFFRAFISIFLCIYDLKKKKIPYFGNNRKLLILRGLFGTLALCLYFYLLQVTPLATAVSLQYLSPIFTIIIASVLLKEKLKLNQWFYFALAFIGVLLIKGFDLNISYTHVAIGCLSAIGSGFAYNFVRMLRVSENPMVVVFYFPLITLPIVLPFTLYQWVTPMGWDWFWVLCIGIFTQLAQINMTYAYQNEKTYKVSIINYIGLLIAIAVGYLFFNESLNLLSVTGMLFIVSSVFLISKNKSTESK